MVNSQGVDVYKYSDQIFSLLNKNITADTTTKNIDLSMYKGRYDNYTWSDEVAIVQFKGRLIMFGLPANSPADGIRKCQYIKRDTFGRIRPDDKTLGEELIFVREENCKIKNARSFSN
ncbi:MAG: hypothetical protein LH478_12350 [Chitinophagaceae bacterium]|nr:hypothetical protein [Chitinophagaceae bacterium]